MNIGVVYTKPVIYVDGQDGTTGLQIVERLESRNDIELIKIDSALRRDNAERARLMNMADIVFLCLPDAAAVEAVELVTNPNTRIIDASTAHRVDPDWDYGFSELSPEHREKIKNSKRVANPGCHASGFIVIAHPLVEMGIVKKDALLTCHSLTGYSGGGKKMIADYENEGRDKSLDSPIQYGLNLSHKHLPEMRIISGLENDPIFNPIVDDFYAGMETTVPLHSAWVGGRSAQQVCDALCEYYKDSALIEVVPQVLTAGTLPANDLAGTDRMRLCVCGNDKCMMVVSMFDNLGKGASGAAVQNMNLMLGFEETTGLK